MARINHRKFRKRAAEVAATEDETIGAGPTGTSDGEGVQNSLQDDRAAVPISDEQLDQQALGSIWDELLDELTTMGVGTETDHETRDDHPEVSDADSAIVSNEEAKDRHALEEDEDLLIDNDSSEISYENEPDAVDDAQELLSFDNEIDSAQTAGPDHILEVGNDEEMPDSGVGDLSGTSPVNAVVRDALVLSMIEKGIVEMRQVFAALRSLPPEGTLWRSVLEQEGVDRDRVLEEVARSNGFRVANIDASHPSGEFILESLSLFSLAEREEMLSLDLLPYEVKVASTSGRYFLIIVTDDPTRSDLSSFIARLDMNVELRFANSSALHCRLEEIISGVESDAGSGEIDRSDYDRLPEEPDQADARIDGNPIESVTDVAPLNDEDTEIPASRLVDQEPTASAPFDQETEEPVTYEDPEVENDVLEILVGQGELSDNEKTEDEPEERGATVGKKPVAKSKDRVVSALLWKRLVTPKQVAAAVRLQKEQGGRELLWRHLARVPEVDSAVLFNEAAEVYAFPLADIGPGRPDREFVLLIMETIAEDRREDLLDLHLLPFEYDIDPQNGAARLIFVTHDPGRPEVHRLLHELNLGRFELRFAPQAVIEKVIEEVFPRKNEYLERIEADPSAVDLGTSYEEKESGLIDEDALEAEISRSTLINLFEATLVEAVRQGASDIHIYPNANRQIEIHFRTDGKLKKWYTEDKVHPESFLAVAKDNSSNVDRFERDMAQDGFIQRWVDGALIRFRVSVLPIASAAQEIRAESIVIRVLDDRKVLTDLQKLGMLDVALERFDRAIRQPYGMVILTGPTGSGKSTTLVAALHQVVRPDVNVLTVEDPVEYIIRGVRQIKLNNKLNLEGALRAILRHDPDVVMVGEMRDKATAGLAIKLANTGHLTFSTLHTNDAPSAVSLLFKMGVEPFLIAYAINLVVAQRLIRGLCPDCKEVDDDPDPVMLERLNFSDDEIAENTFYKAATNGSCPKCGGQGYKGRRAICETMYFTRDIRHMIVEAGEKIDEDAIRTQAVEDGMLTLQESARVLVTMGETSVEEMMRVTATGD